MDSAGIAERLRQLADRLEYEGFSEVTLNRQVDSRPLHGPTGYAGEQLYGEKWEILIRF
jgi:hypothetical protein